MGAADTYRVIEPYNPLSEPELALAVTAKLEAQPMEALPPHPFMGAGLYALYYEGDFRPYRGLRNAPIPIYVGKAEAGSSRHGRVADGLASTKLLQRIQKHAKSIMAAQNLRLEHFSCRFLVTSDAWIVLGEQGLLQSYSPVWNSVLGGFGNNPLGGGRDLQKQSAWDTLHPGRDAAGTRRAPNQKSAENWIALVETRINEQRQALGLPRIP